MIKLKGAFSPNPRLEPLLDGTIKIPGIEIKWQSGRPADLHLMHLTQNAFDIFEFSLSNYIITRSQPSARKRLQWTALPIFFSKAFMWLNFFVHVNSNIKTLADLRGKRVGVPDYHMTAAVWMRILLRELYNIRPEDIEWFNGRPPGISHGTSVRESLKTDIVITQASNTNELKDKLQRGELDAAYGVGNELEETGTVKPLFGNGEAAEVIGNFRQKTGMIPTNHVLIVQQRLIADNPEIAVNIYRAFEMSKQESYRQARKSAPGYLLFADDIFAQQAARYGGDPFPSGLEENKIMLETLARTLLEEGLIGSMPDVNSLFPEVILQSAF